MKTDDGCSYPDDRLYAVDYDLWLKPINGGQYRVGVVQPLLFYAGKPKKISLRGIGTTVRRNTALAVLTTSKTDAVVLTPFNLEVLAINNDVLENPSRIAEDVYGDGWLADVALKEQASGLYQASEAAKEYVRRNFERGVVCLKTVAEFDITIFGESCEGILTQLGDFMKMYLAEGETVHVITSDPATEVDLMDWSEKTGQQLVDIKRVGKTLHAVFRKRA
ncbi:MAG: hypothetical protein RMI49_04160 [Candidatus Caldarchaeum sp.]|nr:hypothetical protein [Candidatus Caldarchaeum sp.]